MIKSETHHSPRWLDSDREAINALLDFKADVHLCGRHLEESMMMPDGMKLEDWVGVFDTCLACNAVERDQKARQAKDGKDELTSGRIWRAITKQEAIQLATAQQEVR